MRAIRIGIMALALASACADRDPVELTLGGELGRQHGFVWPHHKNGRPFSMAWIESKRAVRVRLPHGEIVSSDSYGTLAYLPVEVETRNVPHPTVRSVALLPLAEAVEPRALPPHVARLARQFGVDDVQGLAKMRRFVASHDRCPSVLDGGAMSATTNGVQVLLRVKTTAAPRESCFVSVELSLPDELLSADRESVTMKTASGATRWRWQSPKRLLDDPIVVGDSVVVIGADLFRAGLDRRTGRVLWTGNENGRTGYTRLLPYGNDAYVVRADKSNYREAESGIPDEVWLFRGAQFVATATIAPDEELRGGKRLVAIRNGVQRAIAFSGRD